MIHTKEPANKVFVFVTAYRGHESLEVNEKMLKGLIKTVRTYPGAYGNIRDENVQGCFKEAGMPEAKADWFSYYMAQLAQTYRTRKVMYDNPVHN